MFNIFDNDNNDSGIPEDPQQAVNAIQAEFSRRMAEVRDQGDFARFKRIPEKDLIMSFDVAEYIATLMVEVAEGKAGDHPAYVLATQLAAEKASAMLQASGAILGMTMATLQSADARMAAIHPADLWGAVALMVLVSLKTSSEEQIYSDGRKAIGYMADSPDQLRVGIAMAKRIADTAPSGAHQRFIEDDKEDNNNE